MRTRDHGWLPASHGAVQDAVTGIDVADGSCTAVILVEGLSDCRAVQAWAQRCDRDLSDEGIGVVPMGGATNIGHFLEYLGPHGLDLELAGMCDAREESHFLRGLERAGFGHGLSRRDMETLGFYVCVEDLEDELIRALGTSRVEQAVAEQGELASFRLLQKQPAQRERDVEQQLHRFMGSRSGRKSLYAKVLVEALELSHAPRPLERMLTHV
ncbi:TOPRIM nucleotidyl transferase/hydrolase domain-containing protein [Phytoactinopolyspora endophytica]|uniref:TOPRIM nucleotidyl transferase/hydrolase domain-containing protein n=1 Tax=Phytoactinopolyspora endophytica TaxID=1642495 RepID=UPI00101BA114|nr:TOPRIM nucleotidyl transferase/hydrolase domain-containing protein [Phytoactinopolyspora endophytica]